MIDPNSSFLPDSPSSFGADDSRPPFVVTGALELPDAQSDTELSVLVIEDDDLDFMQVARNLQHGRKRLVLSHSTSIGAALEELRARSFDVILTDLSLPDCSGTETVRRLKEVCRDVPILVMTGLDDESVEQEILDSGAQDYLPKGTANSSWTRKAIEHAVQRQRSINEMNRVTEELQESHRLLREQSELREQDNRKLERLHQTAHEFLVKASHDIRNPLTVIKEHVSIVRDGLAGPVNGEQASMLEKAMVRADDVNSKLDDLLDSSKLDSGLLDICRRPCQVSEILETVRSALRQRAAMRNVQLDIQQHIEVPTAYCDDQKACRVLLALGVNAINACNHSGNVSIWVRHDPSDQQIRIGVTDDGVGMMPELTDRLSKRFARPGLTTEADDRFLGLGLSIASRFCRLNLGQLHVESQSGLGSVFWFDVPVLGSTEIFSRWLESLSAPMRYVQLISFHVHEQCSAAEKRDIELLLTYLAENDELLVQASPTQWWLASSSSSSNIDARMNKANSEIARLTEVRAASPSFEIGIEKRAIWDLQEPSAQIADEYQQIVDAERKRTDL